MIESKLITLLSTLSKEEMRRLGKFMEGTAERKVPDRMAFFDYLERYHPEFSEKKIKREVVAEKLFPKNDKRLKKVENLMHKMVLVLEDFIAYEELKVQQSQRDFLLLEAYKRRKLDDFFFKKIKKIESEWEREKPEGIEQLHNDYLIKKMSFTHPNYVQTSRSLITYEVLIQQLDRYYFAKKLFWSSCLKITEDFVNVSSVDFGERQLFVQKILDICLNNNSLQNGQIKFLAELLNTLITENFQNYVELEQQFISNVISFDESERVDMINLLNNISYRDFMAGQREALYRAFELNKRAIENKWILRNEHIPVFLFSNIVSIACSVEELDWARQFIDTFSTSLDENLRDDIVAISHSTIDFRTKEYEKILERLKFIKFRNVLYKTHERAIRLRCYYELGNDYIEPFFSLVKSFNNFLHSQLKRDLARDSAQGFKNFVKFVEKLGEERLKYSPSVELILKEIKVCDQVFYKQWLLEKANNLKKI